MANESGKTSAADAVAMLNELRRAGEFLERGPLDAMPDLPRSDDRPDASRFLISSVSFSPLAGQALGGSVPVVTLLGTKSGRELKIGDTVTEVDGDVRVTVTTTGAALPACPAIGFAVLDAAPPTPRLRHDPIAEAAETRRCLERADDFHYHEWLEQQAARRERSRMLEGAQGLAQALFGWLS